MDREQLHSFVIADSDLSTTSDIVCMDNLGYNATSILTRNLMQNS